MASTVVCVVIIANFIQHFIFLFNKNMIVMCCVQIDISYFTSLLIDVLKKEQRCRPSIAKETRRADRCVRSK